MPVQAGTHWGPEHCQTRTSLVSYQLCDDDQQLINIYISKLKSTKCKIRMRFDGLLTYCNLGELISA